MSHKWEYSPEDRTGTITYEDGSTVTLTGEMAKSFNDEVLSLKNDPELDEGEVEDCIQMILLRMSDWEDKGKTKWSLRR